MRSGIKKILLDHPYLIGAMRAAIPYLRGVPRRVISDKIMVDIYSKEHRFLAMMRFFDITICLLAIVLLSACSAMQTAPGPLAPTAASGLSGNETKTLASLKQVDDYPLYTMQYYGEYASRQTLTLPAANPMDPPPGWACSLFTVLLAEDHLLYGRNFDWQFSPALLVFTDPPAGYASVSMVDMEYLGFGGETVFHLTDLPLVERQGLLNAPLIPFDGMNEHGLAIGMAAVPPGDMQLDSSKNTIGSLAIMREILDYARDVQEAVKIIKNYNILFDGGPPIHYLIADASGQAVLVEYYQSNMHVITNDRPWLSATNFLVSSVEDPSDGNCWRYNRINARLNTQQGLLDSDSAMELLAAVAQENTQWSVVYQMARREVSVAMGRDYGKVQTFQALVDLDAQ